MNSNDNKTIVMALGGSIIVPEKINTEFLKGFRNFILKFLDEGKRFVIVAGGGITARNYQNAASEIVDISDEDKDWIGIHATRLNGHLLRTVFFDVAHPIILDDPTKDIGNEDKHNLFIASGWKPGWSTDYIAVMLAVRFHTDSVLIATRIDYVYDDDIEKNPSAKRLEKLSWQQYRKMVGDEWTPGMKAPVDPIAAKLAEEKSVEAIIVKGTELENLAKAVRGEDFKGSVIR
ncbi:MAG: hypothetical protein A3B96_03105 [Candidatus Spechtbacteria bacterium RIFCSPHIGHO2_02_FULL_43_15b]|uniref:UMP kinase n=1 Tax=Candidatus Spechtbacteria bacterium RIFCSPHIGHO2_01_FULL_43_30 TaxID=1802158 RepID=A0A1G2H8T8_9BACT|nr:MAG: hypothetical protein A2827_00545 [Candidatus Spechtbacteria bacterium RIFCSPHIGHO2_01_FULL_43_30]OGZ59732.1 MAG: hypothetical protein A3B96_03105 [Candidatus Spechtbacteria bacterium RIFCSPHIGHO2_02_FULL_43_15b]